MLLECTFIEGVKAERAYEVLRVVLFIHRCNTPTNYRIVAASAEWSSFRVKVFLAEWETIMIVEAARIKRTATFLHREKTEKIYASVANLININ